MRISIIAPFYNVKNHIEDFLRSLSEQTYRDFEVILIDDSSTDNSANIVRKYFPSARIIHNSKRLGAIKSRNIGIRNSRSSYIALLDSDTLVDREWLKKLFEVIHSDMDIGICAPKILKYSEPNIIDSLGHSLYYDFSPMHRKCGGIGTAHFNKNQEIFGMCLAGALFRKEVFEKVGLFDEDYGQNFGDDEWTWRARLAGYKCIYVPASVMYHKRQQTSELDLRLLFLWERNRIWSMIKYYSLIMILESIYYSLKRYVISIFLYLIIKKKKNKLSTFTVIITILYAWWEALLKFPLFIKKRKWVRQICKVSNLEMRSWLNKNWESSQY